MRYEIIYLVGGSQEANLEEIKKTVEKVITDFSGVWEEKEWTESKKLAYKIKKDNQGTYVARRFGLEEKTNIVEMKKQLSLLPEVLRFMISKTDDLPENYPGEIVEKKDAEKQPAKIGEEEKEPKKETPKEELVSEEKDVKMKEEDIDKKLEEILNI